MRQNLVSPLALTISYLAKGLSEVLGQEGVQEGVDATAAVGQDMCYDLSGDGPVRYRVPAYRLEHENYLKGNVLIDAFQLQCLALQSDVPEWDTNRWQIPEQRRLRGESRGAFPSW